MDVIEGELEGFVARSQWTRRGFVMTSLATGFALSVQPVSAETIHTDATGLEAGEVKVPVADGSIPAYRAMPDTGGPFPTVLVVQEIFGVHEHIKDICRRFAKLGYYAIAPELYARQGNPAEISDIKELIAKIVSKVPDAQVMSDLDATRGLCQVDRQGRYGEARDHRVLLGRADHLALRGAQSGSEGRGRMVRPDRSAAHRRSSPNTRSIWHPNSNARCSAFMAAPIRASRAELDRASMAGGMQGRRQDVRL